MSEVRAAAVAGRFYPGQTAQLEQDVDAMLQHAQTDAPCPKALVAPHAGYVYSGQIAAEVYARVRNGADHISRVILLGPSHRVGFDGIATSSADFYTTPLGQIPLDKSSMARVEELPGVSQLDQAHAHEHSLEVHLPFLQRCLDRFVLVPLVVGQAEPASVANVIEALWGGPETLIVISSDLSHHLPYAQAQATDAQTRELIEARHTEIRGDQACGCRPLNGLLEVLRRRDLAIETVAVKNSGDTAGSKDSVVGYGAWVVDENKTASQQAGGKESTEQADAATLGLGQRQQLLYLARSAILHGLSGGGELKIELQHFHPDLQAQRSSFVTLDVANNAAAAAFKDRRFKPLQRSEFSDLDVHISVLSPARPLAVNSREELLEKLRAGVDGLVLQDGSRRATYLPSVWEKLQDPDQFVGELRLKAGLPREGWSETIQVSTYSTEEFS
jgi:AmmeMemoRadiSam system protein B